MTAVPTVFGQDNWSIVDLTMTIEDGMDAFPGEPTANFAPFSTLSDVGVEMWHVSLFSQLGTHVDAPSHFIAGAPTIDKVPLEASVGGCSVADVDVTSGDEIEPRHLEVFEDSIRRTRRVLIRTGWDAEYGSERFWTEFPELSVEAAHWLVDAGVKFVGLDTPSPHRHQMHEVHRVLLSSGVVLTECLRNLGRLGGGETLLICLPLPLKGLDGSPARVVALEPVEAA